MKDQPITSIMSKNVHTIDAKGTLKQAETIMRKYHIRHIPVVKNRKLVGILSLTDLQRLSFVDNFGDEENDADIAVYNLLGIEQVMVGTPVTLSQTDTVGKAAEILSSSEFHALPIVQDERVVGIVTTTDLIRHFLRYVK